MAFDTESGGGILPRLLSYGEKNMKIEITRRCRVRGVDCQPGDVIETDKGTALDRIGAGLAKKYARTGKLPPGWEKKMQPIPVAVERQLAPLPRDYRRGIVDGFAIVYNSRTGVTIDVVALFGS